MLSRQGHPYAWLWESLEADPSFVLRAMFGTKAVYLDGRLVFSFCAGEEPWRGMLVCATACVSTRTVAQKFSFSRS